MEKKIKKKDRNLIKIKKDVWISMQYEKTFKKHKEEVKKKNANEKV